MNTKNSLMTVELKTAELNRGNRIQILPISEQIIEVNDTGVSVYDWVRIFTQVIIKN